MRSLLGGDLRVRVAVMIFSSLESAAWRPVLRASAPEDDLRNFGRDLRLTTSVVRLTGVILNKLLGIFRGQCMAC